MLFEIKALVDKPQGLSIDKNRGVCYTVGIVKEGILSTISSWERNRMETKTMEKKKKIEEARKRLEKAENGGYYVQAFLAQVEFEKLLY